MSVSYLVVRKRLEKRKSSQQNQLLSQDLLTDPFRPLRALRSQGYINRSPGFKLLEALRQCQFQTFAVYYDRRAKTSNFTTSTHKICRPTLGRRVVNDLLCRLNDHWISPPVVTSETVRLSEVTVIKSLDRQIPRLLSRICQPLQRWVH
jgi:hypothetical protein